MGPEPAQQIILTKHHGLGNDFLIAIDPPRPLRPEDAIAWCDRRQGIGADGLVQATRSPGTDRWQMVLHNSDGGRAEISGNGLRCLAQALADRLDHDRADELALAIDTDAGPREAVVLAHPPDAPPTVDTVTVDTVTVTMGKAVEGPAPSDRWSELGVEVTGQVGVDLGNPHLVGFVDRSSDLGRLDMATIGPAIEADHPGGLNVHLVAVTGRAGLEMTIWERGAGVTLACGSGACAAAWAATRAGLLEVDADVGREEAWIDVAMPGGSARVRLTDDEVILAGPATRIGEVRLDG